MAAEDIRKYVDERLEYISKELLDIAETISESPLQERLSILSDQIEKLVYEALKAPSQTTSEAQEAEKNVDHRIKTSYGGVPEMFNGALEEPLHQHSVSFGGIRQLFDVEMEVFEAEVPSQGANGHVDENGTGSTSPHLSPTYKDVDLLFKDGPLQGTENFDGVSGMFRKSEYTTINLGAEFDPENRPHHRTISFGGVKKLAADGDDEVELEDMNQQINAESNNNIQRGFIEDTHNRVMSLGGARQMINVECDVFSGDEVQKSSPKVSNIVQENVQGHDRTISTGGVRQLDQVAFEEELFDLDNRAAKMTNELKAEIEDDQSDALDDEEASAQGDSTHVGKDRNHVEESRQDHERTVSYGGVKPIQDFEMDVFDELGEDMERKPRELFDGQGTVEDPSGHERRRSNLQDGRELFEGPVDLKAQSGATFEQMKVPSFLERENPHPEESDRRQDDLKRELLQLKMSKIDLIKSTAEEIDRLRGIIKTLAVQLRYITEDHKKLLNTTLGGQMLDSVSGVFGTFTSFFSAAPEPSPVYRNS